MKTIHALAACLAASLAMVLSAVPACARSFDDIKKDGKIVIATEGQFSPFNYFQGARLSGFEIEVAEQVAKRMGVQVEWKALSFDALLAGLRQDRWDLVIASHGITEERSKAVSFTEPHYCSGGVVVSTDPAIRTARDLSGRVVAVQTGSTYLDNVKKLVSAKEVKNFPQDTDARSALIAHRVDAWVTDRFVAKLIAESNPSLGLKLGDFIFVERIAAAAGKGNSALVQAYNGALADLMRDGTYAAISKKYFNEDIRCK
jgi:polar amino acid transport system substrate-binding protein